MQTADSNTQQYYQPQQSTAAVNSTICVTLYLVLYSSGFVLLSTVCSLWFWRCSVLFSILFSSPGFACSCSHYSRSSRPSRCYYRPRTSSCSSISEQGSCRPYHERSNISLRRCNYIMYNTMSKAVETHTSPLTKSKDGKYKKLDTLNSLVKSNIL